MSKYVVFNKVYATIEECKNSMEGFNVRGRIRILEITSISYEPINLWEVWANLKYKWTLVESYSQNS